MSQNPRTCIASKKQYPSQDMIRCTIQEGALLWEEDQVKREGRGGYVFPSEENIKKLPRLKGKIEYLLKTNIKTFNLPEEPYSERP